MASYWRPQLNTYPAAFQDNATVGTFTHANKGMELRPPNHIGSKQNLPVILDITVINKHATNTLSVSFDNGEHWVELENKDDAASMEMYTKDPVLVKGSAADTSFQYFGQYCHEKVK